MLRLSPLLWKTTSSSRIQSPYHEVGESSYHLTSDLKFKGFSSSRDNKVSPPFGLFIWEGGNQMLGSPLEHARLALWRVWMSLLITLAVSMWASELALWLLVYKWYGHTAPCVSMSTTGMHGERLRVASSNPSPRPSKSFAWVGVLAKFCSLTQAKLPWRVISSSWG